MSDALCIWAAGKLLVLAASSFTLSWTHSVEKIEWWESWQLETDGLQIVEARVQGAGAGMEAPAGATSIPGGWAYRPDLPAIRRLVLAASGRTASGWRLCAGTDCRELATESGDPIELWPAERGECLPGGS